MSYYYLAGPMTGYPDFNFAAFDTAKADLERMGFGIVSPADLDREHGFDPHGMEGTPEELDALGFHREDAIARDIAAIASRDCVGIFTLPGAEGSKGARVEIALAEFLGKPVAAISGAEYSSVQDSGQRQEFETGSWRDTRQGKGRFDLIPTVPLERLARHYENGAAKYGDRNWEKGQPLSRYLDSAFRHLVAAISGKRDEDHLSAVAWNVFAFVATEQWISDGVLPTSLNDLPRRGSPCSQLLPQHSSE